MHASCIAPQVNYSTSEALSMDTHINSYPSAAGPVQTSESSPVRDGRSTAVPPNQLIIHVDYVDRPGYGLSSPSVCLFVRCITQKRMTP